ARPTSADEEDYSELAIIAPTFPGEEAEDNDDFSIVSREKSYIDVATNFFKVSHPPIRIGSLLVINYFQALKSNEGIFIEIIKSPRCSSFYHSNILHKTKHMPDTIWPLSDDVISQQIFMYLEELTALHCPHGNLRKAIAVHLLWPEAMITYISMDKKISKDDATMLYKDKLGLI
ncbi:PREDICTED: uncharacterized protein LOC109592627, partial [Amphimedon queenslandica]|uniref:Uncharacterized protein n=1 Tax=Amphimedon queenslandica TaxID=400682 RepID=A0AAN0K363_AMPQE